MGLYVYAVLDAADPPPRLPRLPRLRYVDCGRITAAVRSAPAAPAPRPAALQRHARVVHELWQAAPALLPARFGSLVADEEELRRELRPRARALGGALALVRGRVQMTLRVLEAARGPRVPAAAPPASGRQYLAARAAWWRGDDVAGLPRLLAALRRLRAAERIERDGPPGTLARVHHLVDRGRVAEYRRALARARGGLRLRVSGPWPPYAFVPAVDA